MVKTRHFFFFTEHNRRTRQRKEIFGLHPVRVPSRSHGLPDHGHFSHGNPTAAGGGGDRRRVRKMKTSTAACIVGFCWGRDVSGLSLYIILCILLLSVLLFFTYNYYYASIRVYTYNMRAYCARDRSIVLALYIYYTK